MMDDINKRRRTKRQHGYRHVNEPLHNPIRVRSKRLDEVAPDKAAAAFWALARRLAEEAEKERDGQRDASQTAEKETR